MIFYSMSIQKVQSYCVSEIQATEYANSMMQLAENLVVNVGRNLPGDKRIPGGLIKDWTTSTLKYF
jgi:hypothetical protein